ncbi:peptidase domain-containing ABC transporter [Xylophilus sp. ASV27]|uniref:peptidase domain-containing ABC transporter n=1 Tax=Xylophilus sp. ASV27 TaxID=2795129 RepID=UPI0018EC584E|nr:ATP-binding cassette domain-containing protein [Xylophilus sp. ASV27]
MIKFLLPRQLVAQRPAPPESGACGDAVGVAFRTAYPTLVRAAWWSVPISIFGLLPSIFTLQIYERVIYRSGFATLAAMVAGMFCVLAVEFWMRTQRSRRLRDAGATIDHGVSNALIQSMLKRPLRMLEARPASAWFALFRDVGAVRGTVTGGLMLSIFDLPMAFFALVLIGIIAWPVLPAVLAFLAVLSFLAWWWADEVRAGRVEETGRGRDLDRATAEICRARETLKTLAHDEPTVRLWRETYDAWLAESFRKNGQIERARESATVLLTVFSTVVFAVGAVAVLEQWMTVGSMIAANMLAAKALSPVAGLASNWRALAAASEAASRLEKVLQEPLERAPTGVKLPQPRGRVRLQGVSFQYASAPHPVLKEVDLEMGPGGLHAIVGRNGSGKSTLARLIGGLYTPDQGKVRLDEYDIAQFSREELAEWVSTLSQEVYWFGGELIEALRRAAPQQSDEQIVAACRLAGAHEFISRLPAGYRTAVGEGGAGLSVGERRKLALAQLFLRSPSVLLLDEPSNDLDFQSESTLLAALAAVARHRTVLVVTHSLRIASMAQRVYHVTGNGDVEQGTPAVMVPRLFGVKVPAVSVTEPSEPEAEPPVAVPRAVNERTFHG